MAAEHPSTPPPHAGGPELTRRTLIKTVGLTAGAGAIAVSDLEPIGDAEAIVPALVAGAAGMYVAHEIGLLGDGAPPEGLTASALKLQAYRTALTRQSTNASTFVDNRNIINYIPELAFSEAKSAMRQAINDGKTQSEVEAAGKSAAASHFVTVEKNFLKSWNESVSELSNTASTIRTHGSVGEFEVLWPNGIGDFYDMDDWNESGPNSWGVNTNSVTLRDGTSFDISEIWVRTTWNDPNDSYSTTREFRWTPLNYVHDDSIDNTGASSETNHPENYDLEILNPDGSNVDYLSYQGWNNVWSDIQSQFDQIDSDIVTWVNNTYDSIQAGDIDTADTITAVDLANTGDVPQAIADIIAANIPADIDNQITISKGAETMSGYLATTDGSALSSVAPGDTIDPNATDSNSNDLYGDIYIAHDLAEWRYDWTAYDDSKGVDGGYVWYNQDPAVIDGMKAETTLYHTIDTGAGERATVTPADFTETTDGSGNTVWEVDLSDKLETTITTVESVTVAADASDYAIRLLESTFTVESTESGDSINLTQDRDPQTDNNYVTDEEWQALLDQQKKLIEKFEESQDSSSSLFGGLFDGSTSLNIPTLPGLGVVETVVVGFLALAGFNVATS